MAALVSRRLRAPALALLAVLLAGGCSITETLNDATRIDYKGASKGPPLDIPPDLVTPRGEERFAVPERSAGGTTFSEFNRERTTERPVAAGPSVIPPAPGVRLERQGNQRWLVIDQPPEKVWPVVRDFWGASGFALRIESPESGIMETDWAERRANVPDSWVRNQLTRALGSLYATGERDKYRTRLESDGKATEIFVSHRGLVEELVGVSKESTVWVPRPSDPELEAEFLQRLMQRFQPEKQASLAARQGAAAGASAAVPAGAEPMPPKVAIVEVDGRPFVQMPEGFDRSWRQVGLALDRSGFTVEDRDRSKGTFFVRYVDPVRDSVTPGAFERVFGSSTKKDLSGRRYRIVVAAESSGARVGVLGEDGNPPSTDADRRVATQIVTLLRDQLR
jgi:outer membrane protein assembly factor BamC